MSEQKVLFCPFCRESFEGERTCPEHEIALVPFERLREDASEWDEEDAPRALHDDTVLPLFEPRFGRAWVAAGATLNALALVLEFVRGVKGSAGLRTHELAITAPSLWTLLLVSFTLLFVLKRRRTPRAMRGMRVLVPALGLVSPVTVGWVLARLHQGAAVWATGGRVVGLDLGPAVYAVALGSVLTVIGGLKLGVLSKRGES